MIWFRREIANHWAEYNGIAPVTTNIFDLTIFRWLSGVKQGVRINANQQLLSENSMTEIREATNKARVLGNDRFKQSWIEELSDRQS